MNLLAKLLKDVLGVLIDVVSVARKLTKASDNFADGIVDVSEMAKNTTAEWKKQSLLEFQAEANKNKDDALDNLKLK